MGLLDQRRILLGVSGGIAAYKAPELVRRLQDAGADVRVMLTKAAARFVSPLSLEVVSQHPVGVDLWAPDGDSRIVHTDAGQEADLILLAPATANLVARIRHGIADDLVSTTVMACQTPVLVCPSMNTDMLDNPLVRANLDGLSALDRYTLLEPDVGLLACGVTGRGRLPDPPALIEAAALVLAPKDLTGLRAVVTAGPTREAVDPVRYLTNHSTGTMGFALARALAARGATVHLIAGPVALATPVGVARRTDVTTAADLAASVDAAWQDTDALVMAAAVADYRPAAPADQKMTKTAGPLELALSRTQDVLATMGARERGGRLLVGFAAETGDLEARARAKLTRKRLDAIVANDVSAQGVGFGTGDNAGVLITADGNATPLGRSDKQRFAEQIVDHLAGRLVEARSG